ncbi:Uncharacterised protein [Bordetella pertussis]|nr:Uncharacterised protein [Bordetella pertussis]
MAQRHHPCVRRGRRSTRSSRRSLSASTAARGEGRPGSRAAKSEPLMRTSTAPAPACSLMVLLSCAQARRSH